MKTPSSRLPVVIVISAIVLHLPLFAEEAADISFFEERIRPVLVRHCYECHSAAATKLKGGLRLDSRELARTGGDSGAAVVPGHKEASLLLEAMIDGEMPPDGKLPDRIIADFEKWVEAGALDPRDQPPSGEEAAQLSWQLILEERRDWWSLRPVDSEHSPERDIDEFIHAKQENMGVEPVEKADPRTLARRLHLSLTGLPPSPEDIAQFVNNFDKNPEAAYEQLVDKMLGSPHFGEHWARHWQDVVRFAETHGYEWNHEIRDAWRYRDYLIRAFNKDVPYDQLVREHIAGDLLESPRINAKLGINESAIGTAFWRFGELGHDNCVNFPEIRFDAIDNQIDTFSKAFQGLTVSCARCHDHKIDAISTKDYYALVAMLENCSQVVHTLDSPGRIAKAVAETKSLKVEIRQQLGEKWLGASDQMRDTILAALAGETSALTSSPKGKKLGMDNPGSVIQKFAGKPASPLHSAKWIWVGPGANVNEPNPAPFYARFSFDLEAKPDKATLFATADDRVISYVNGVKLGDNQSWIKPAKYDVAKHLSRGRNTIAFEVANVTGPAGFLAAIQLDGRTLGSSKDWKVTRDRVDGWMTAEFVDSAWAPASELGPSSMAPWRLASDRGSLVDPVESLSARWKTLGGAYARIQKSREKKYAEGFELWTDFRTSQDTVWTKSGLGLAGEPTQAGEFALADEGGQIVAAILPAGLHTNVTANKLNGSLRSPWLPTEKKFISIQLRGDRRSLVRTVVDSCSLNETAGGGLEYLIGGNTKWKTFPTSAAPGHRSFVELTTRSDNPRWPDRPGRAGSADPDVVYDFRSSFGVVRAVLHDTPGQPEPDLAPMLPLFEQPIPTDKAGIAAAFEAVTREAISAWKENRATDADVHWLDWMLRVGLLPNSIDEKEQSLAQMVKGYRAIVASIQEPRVVAGLADQGGNRPFPVLQGGDPKERGALVPPRYVEAISGTTAFDSPGSGRRELAERIADPENPLTARVMVNRVWHHLFGRGIVATTDDFGGMGEEPTHPELLDFLAAEFVADGWSTKRLIRRIVLSQSFQQTSTPIAANIQRDPGNRMLHHYPARRLDAEAIRDTILAVSGRLDPTLFGPGIHPHRSVEKDYRKLFIGPLDGNGRRSLYTKITRMQGPQFLELFDFPTRMTTRGTRDRTNVPEQALALLNDPFVLEQAEFWAQQLLEDDHETVDERAVAMFQRATGRPPRKEEQERFVALIRGLADNPGSDEATLLNDRTVWQNAAHVIFNMKEMIYIQ